MTRTFGAAEAMDRRVIADMELNSGATDFSSDGRFVRSLRADRREDHWTKLGADETR